MYALAVRVRNRLYDAHFLPSYRVSVPTICVGNLAVGGTGKTPMTEYIVALLRENGYKVAILSRGYGRTKHGYCLADATATAATIGDEPMQMHLHFPDIPLAVCANRVEGIRRLQQDCPQIQCVVLDDAYQHRRLCCGYSVLLTAYDNLYVNDHFLPYGRLRDSRSQSLRARMVVVTNCPPTMQPIDCRVVSNALHLPHYQHLCFSFIQYELPALPDTPLLVTGIAQPQYMLAYIQQHYPKTELMTFPDHHAYTPADIRRIEKAAAKYACVLTTEKDWVRLQQCALPATLAEKCRVLPIHTDLGPYKHIFDTEILRYMEHSVAPIQ